MVLAKEASGIFSRDDNRSLCCKGVIEMIDHKLIQNMDIRTIEKTGDDGIGIDGDNINHAIIDNCTVNLEAVPLKDQDELLGITHCADTEVFYSRFSHGIKAILCGSGDADKEVRKSAPIVLFRECTIQHFGRRGPEVQNRYVVIVEGCTIRNWGMKDVFDVRAFGAWAHDGGVLIMKNCRFEQTSFFQTGILNFVKDLWNSFWQAWNDEKLLGWLDWKTYLPGVCKGAFATDKGYIKLINCTKNKWWIYLQNNRQEVDSSIDYMEQRIREMAEEKPEQYY